MAPMTKEDAPAGQDINTNGRPSIGRVWRICDDRPFAVQQSWDADRRFRTWNYAPTAAHRRWL